MKYICSPFRGKNKQIPASTEMSSAQARE